SFFSLLVPRAPRSTLFPYTTLFRSGQQRGQFRRQRAAASAARGGDDGHGIHDWSPPPIRRLPRITRASSCGGSRTLRRGRGSVRSEEHTSELQSRRDLVCRLLLEKK